MILDKGCLDGLRLGCGICGICGGASLIFLILGGVLGFIPDVLVFALLVELALVASLNLFSYSLN